MREVIGSNPICVQYFWAISLVGKTPASQVGVTGSNPVSVHYKGNVA